MKEPDGIFRDVTVTWDGVEYTLKGDDESSFMKAIAIVEDHVNIGDLASGKRSISKLSQAYGGLLRYLGARVTDQQVYLAIYKSSAAEVEQTITNLIMLLIPPGLYDADDDGDDGKKPESEGDQEKD